MKKFTIALLALVLVCSSVFAAASVTAGIGFGGFMVPQKLDVVNYLYDAGPAAFIGFDYVTDKGLTVYDDLAFNLAMIDNGHKYTEPDFIKNLIFATDYLGVGYTFDVDKFTVMVGVGAEGKMAISGWNVVADEGAKFITIGAGLRCKAAYNLKDNLAVTFQANGSFDFKTISAHGDGTPIEILGCLDVNELKFASANALVGVTYKF